MPTTHHRLVVVGAGFGGIALAVRLRQAGIEDFVVLERGPDVGGTWRENTYPGCACDVPSQLYSLSFAPNPDWSRTYGRQPEILAYLQQVARTHDVRRFMRFGVEVRSAQWDEAAGRWRVTTDRGPLTAEVLVGATGVFAEPVIPPIRGLETFAGTAMHTLRWDHGLDLRGRRVAVVGTGASAVQVIPAIASQVEHLSVFQRTPPWIVPRLDRATSTIERTALRRVPLLRRGVRAGWYGAIEAFGLPGFVDPVFRHPYEALGRLQLRRQVRDPQLRRRLTPDYQIGCKRAIFSDAYYPALTRDNVELVTDRITEVRPGGIVTADGLEHRLDTIVWGTGFRTPPGFGDRVRGRDGLTLNELWHTQPQSYLGTSVRGFPNYFAVLGVFGAAGNQSAIYMIESQVAYIVDAVCRMRADGARRVEVRAEVQDGFVAEMERRSQRTVWLTGGCTSYYTTPDGRNSGLYPNWSFEYRRRTRRFDPADYEVTA